MHARVHRQFWVFGCQKLQRHGCRLLARHIGAVNFMIHSNPFHCLGWLQDRSALAQRRLRSDGARSGTMLFMERAHRSLLQTLCWKRGLLTTLLQAGTASHNGFMTILQCFKAKTAMAAIRVFCRHAAHPGISCDVSLAGCVGT